MQVTMEKNLNSEYNKEKKVWSSTIREAPLPQWL